MKKFYQLLNQRISDALDGIGYHLDDVIVTDSNRRDLGEYQFNGVMNLAKEYHENPLVIANKLVDALKQDSFFKDVNVAGPGFINLTVSDQELINFVNNNDYEYEKNNKLIFLDYGGANVAKSLHVGHLRSANIGEALKRLCNYMGYNTISDTHLGDWGRPLGLVILELSKRHPDWVYFDENYTGEYPDINITSELLEEIYPYASNRAKEDDIYLKEAQNMTYKLQTRVRGIYALWKHIMDVSKKDIKYIYDRLHATFDLYKGESDAELVVPELLKYLDGLNIVYESEGAKVIDVKEDDDTTEIPPMLLIKSDGGILYSTTELATLYSRINEYHPDEIWYITDKRQNLHFTQVFRAANKASITKNTKLVFAGFGTMNGKDGKPFKTRDGGVMRLVDLLDEVKNESLKRLEDSNISNKYDIAEDVSMSAVKYADMLPNRESDYIFDIEKFCMLEGKTGPYVLYSVVRMKSLLNKAKEFGFTFEKMNSISNEYDLELILLLNKLDGILNNAFLSKDLNNITNYLFDLANAFNSFYTENIIIKETDELKRESWLYLTNEVFKVCKILLNILAISVPDKM